MNTADREHKDIRNVTYIAADLRAQLASGKVRWLATILAFAGAGLFVFLILEGKGARLDFPFQVEGPAALWMVGVASAIWFAIAAVNWRAWMKKRSLR
jgi:hypothetical protein